MTERLSSAWKSGEVLIADDLNDSVDLFYSEGVKEEVAYTQLLLTAGLTSVTSSTPFVPPTGTLSIPIITDGNTVVLGRDITLPLTNTVSMATSIDTVIVSTTETDYLNGITATSNADTQLDLTKGNDGKLSTYADVRISGKSSIVMWKVDLGEIKTGDIHSKINVSVSSGAGTTTYKLQISSDDSSWTDLQSTTVSEGSSTLYRRKDSSKTCRYIRILGSVPSGYYLLIKVYEVLMW